jgi:hypothetical protein
LKRVGPEKNGISHRPGLAQRPRPAPGVVAWWEGRGFCKELRERFLLGANKGGTAAVIPFWNRGRVQGLIRRKLEGEPKYIYPETEEFPAGLPSRSSLRPREG